MPSKWLGGALIGAIVLSAASAFAQSGCAGLPDHDALRNALIGAVAAETSGLNHQMWATIVDRDGVVCAVAFSGSNRGAQWPGSRVISAQKANTANAFSLDSLALSTANLYSAVQPFGGSLYGLQHSNPVDAAAAYGTAADAPNYGQANDPMVGKRIGGVNVFGGGFGLYIGVSGDPDRPDNIIYDIAPGATAGAIGVSPSGFGHPTCLNTADPSTLPKVAP